MWLDTLVALAAVLIMGFVFIALPDDKIMEEPLTPTDNPPSPSA
jgi:hypothetical protein